MSESSETIDLSNYDHSFVLAYDLLLKHIASGSSTTADLPICLAELTEVFKKYAKETCSKDQS